MALEGRIKVATGAFRGVGPTTLRRGLEERAQARGDNRPSRLPVEFFSPVGSDTTCARADPLA
jgi:hypothetical protein